MEYKESPYGKTDMRTLYWDFAISNNEDPEIAVERDIKYLIEYIAECKRNYVPEKPKTIEEIKKEIESLPF